MFIQGFYIVQEIMEHVSARLGSGLTTSFLNLIFSIGEKKVAPVLVLGCKTGGHNFLNNYKK